MAGVSVPVIDGVVRFTLAYNQGAAFSTSFGPYQRWLLVGFTLVILAVVAGRGLSLGWLRSRPLAELGVISYGFYLWHVPLILFVKAMAAQTPSALELAALVAPLALAAGTASWLWVERPLMNAVNSRLARAPARA